MKINKPQIEDLYIFIRKHFVEHYDLQTELVDHLANDIEETWKEEPKLSFEEARNRSFKKFGVCGFMDVVEQRQKAMNKRYLRYLWSYLKHWFKLPQLLITIIIFISFYFSFVSQYAKHSFLISYAILTFCCIYKGIQLYKQFKRKKEYTKRKWLLEEIIFRQASGFGLFFIPQIFNIYNFSDNLFSNNAIIILSIASTLFVICNYICLWVLPKEAENLLSETYPEYSL